MTYKYHVSFQISSAAGQSFGESIFVQNSPLDDEEQLQAVKEHTAKEAAKQLGVTLSTVQVVILAWNLMNVK